MRWYVFIPDNSRYSCDCDKRVTNIISCYNFKITEISQTITMFKTVATLLMMVAASEAAKCKIKCNEGFYKNKDECEC